MSRSEAETAGHSSFSKSRQKVFDEFKNKLGEKKSWASSAAAKTAQANFLCLTHNLRVLYEHRLASAGLCNEAEEKRRSRRLEKRTEQALKAGRKMPSIISGVQWLTQRRGETAKSCNLTRTVVLECCAIALPIALRRCAPAPAI